MRQHEPALNPCTLDYFAQARQPLVCLVFLVPFLAVYELGVWYFRDTHADAVRSGADFWLRGALESFGLVQPLILPVLIVAGLLAWQALGKHSWHFNAGTLAGMGAESLLFAFALIIVGQLQDLVFQHAGVVTTSLPPVAEGALARGVAFVGAGVYEEVLFRLGLLPLCFAAFRMSRLSRPWAASLAIVSTAVIFSLAHYIGPAADELTLFSCMFRTVAGIFFGTLFFVRGFGITVGCHAAYDLLVGIAMSAA